MVNPAHTLTSGFVGAFAYVLPSTSMMKDCHVFIIKQNQVLVKCSIVIISDAKQRNDTNIGYNISHLLSSYSKKERPSQADCSCFPSGVYSNHLFLYLSPSLSFSCHSRLSLNYALPLQVPTSLKWLFLPHRRLLLVIICIIIKFDELLRDIKSHLTQVLHFASYTQKEKCLLLLREIHFESCNWHLD